jgi:hypothetical protein
MILADNAPLTNNKIFVDKKITFEKMKLKKNAHT